jgi:nitronate monooxygenase
MRNVLRTRFTQRFGLTTPIVSAPMAGASGGALAQAVSDAGALGFVGGGYGELEWIRRELVLCQPRQVGCGFVTWAIEKNDHAFSLALEHKPKAMFLSFGDPRSFARRATVAGIPVFCQIQEIAQLSSAIEAGAEVIVAQGSEAGGHGLDRRSVMCLVPEVRDWLDLHAPHVLLLAAGGIADGRGVAASLMLGADGVVVGTRFWATVESLAVEEAKQYSLALNGDTTIRSGIFDILRRKNWPRDYSFRAYRNALHRSWEGRECALAANPTQARADFEKATLAFDYESAHITVGECIGLIDDLPNAGDLVRRMSSQAISHLTSHANGLEYKKSH